jgi:hypothetical protein
VLFQRVQPESVQEHKDQKARIHCGESIQKSYVITWEETNAPGARFTVGLNLKVFGLMAATAISEQSVEGEVLMAPASNSEKDLNLEQLGLEATGLAITTLSDSLISIFNKYLEY